MLRSPKLLVSIAIIALSTKVRQILLQADALCLLVSKWLLRVIAVLGLRRLDKSKPTNTYRI
jgi:hypothetical protein